MRQLLGTWLPVVTELVSGNIKITHAHPCQFQNIKIHFTLPLLQQSYASRTAVLSVCL
jgi:hypothetical protein